MISSIASERKHPAAEPHTTSNKFLHRGPHSTILIFLQCTLLWIFASQSSEDDQKAVLSQMGQDAVSQSQPLRHLLTMTYGTQSHSTIHNVNSNSTDVDSGEFLREAALCLQNCTPWGMALNLALLLNWRLKATASRNAAG